MAAFTLIRQVEADATSNQDVQQCQEYFVFHGGQTESEKKTTKLVRPLQIRRAGNGPTRYGGTRRGVEPAHQRHSSFPLRSTYKSDVAYVENS